MLIVTQESVLAVLREQEFVVGDGAMGTMLQANGLTDGGAPELWNVEWPEVIESVYRGYAEAGAQIIETNTFGGNLARLRFHGIGNRVYELNRAGVETARRVADEVGALVAGSVGPTGDLIEPVGSLTMDEAEGMFAAQIIGLLDGGVDLVLIETMSHLNEVEAAIRGARCVDPDLFIAVTMSFDTNLHTMMGVSPRQAIESLAALGVRLVGANCGNGPAEIEAVMQQMAQYRPDGVYLYAQSNAGLPHYDNGEIRYDGTPEVMANYATTMRNLGVNVIGACCGSTPAHIRAMKSALEAVKGRPIEGPSAVASAYDKDKSISERTQQRQARRRQRSLSG